MRLLGNKVKLKTMCDIQSVMSVIQELAAKIPTKDFAGLGPYHHQLNYTSTPTNCIPFASTGGDGTHYSFLQVDKEKCPVVMTCPMNGGVSPAADNMVIAENINEFLSIGFYNGWFALEQLFYDKPSAIDFFASEDMNVDFQHSGGKKLVHLINVHFNLTHLPPTEQRLVELDEKYFHLLKFTS